MAKRKHKPLPDLTQRQLAAFWDKVNKLGASECWEWTSKRNKEGYGQYWIAPHKRPFIASRISYKLATGRDPAELQVLHRCDNPPCMNPNHFFLGDNRDNAKDSVTKGRNYLVKPHEHARGNQCVQAKLNPEVVLSIRRLHESGMNYRAITREIGIAVSWQRIRDVVLCISWKHVTG